MSSALRERVAQAFTVVEDVVYVGLGLLLAASAVALLVDGVLDFGKSVVAFTTFGRVIAFLDRILLILIFVEVLYTVQVSFREHTLAPEPFLIVGLIAATRRILVLTASIAELAQAGREGFVHAMLELGLMTVMVLALVVALVLLRRRSSQAVAERA
jgi:phosphate starvation-inducible membrane PsiE